MKRRRKAGKQELAVGPGDWPPRVLAQPAPLRPGSGRPLKVSRRRPEAPAPRSGREQTLPAQAGSPKPPLRLPRLFTQRRREHHSCDLQLPCLQISLKLTRVVNLLQPVRPQTHSQTHRRPPGPLSRCGGCPRWKAPGNHLGPRAPGTRCSSCGPPNSGRFAQTPLQPSEGGERPANSGAAAVRSRRRTELRGWGCGLWRCGAQPSAPRRPRPGALPPFGRPPRRARRPARPGTPETVLSPSCPRPPRCRALERQAPLPTSHVSLRPPIKQKTNVNNFLLINCVS